MAGNSIHAGFLITHTVGKIVITLLVNCFAGDRKLFLQLYHSPSKKQNAQYLISTQPTH